MTLSSSLAVEQFNQIVTPPLDEARKCALKILFADDMLAKGYCTKADGRELLDQTLLRGIKFDVGILN